MTDVRPRSRRPVLGPLLAVMASLALACESAPPDKPGAAGTPPAGESTEIDFEGSNPPASRPAPLGEDQISQLPVIDSDLPESTEPFMSELAAPRCWVTLNYCRHPSSGNATCTATPGCEGLRDHPSGICANLIRRYCGNIIRNGVSCARYTNGGSWSCWSY